MYTQFFGNYLLNKNIITPEQLVEAMQAQKDIHLKLGVLAIHAGLLTAQEVQQIHIKQTHVDKRFGEIAVDEGYLTSEQVDELLSSQVPSYLRLGQALVDKGYIDISEFQNTMIDYQSEHELTDDDFSNEQQEKVDCLIREFFNFDEVVDADYLYDYISLLFNNIVRFIGEDFTIFPIVRIGAYPINWCVSQDIIGSINLHTAMDMDEQTLIAFASRYVGDEFDENDDYVKASLEDFLNLHNGLFTVNQSNDSSIELHLGTPKTENDVLFIPETPVYYIPIQFSFGMVNFIFVIK